MRRYQKSDGVPYRGTKCRTCGQPCEPEFTDHATCYGCLSAFGAIYTDKPHTLADVPAWPMHVGKVLADPDCGFACGFCGEWRQWAEHGYIDKGVRHCTRCVDALDALRDGAADALSIFRGGE